MGDSVISAMHENGNEKKGPHSSQHYAPLVGGTICERTREEHGQKRRKEKNLNCYYLARGALALIYII